MIKHLIILVQLIASSCLASKFIELDHDLSSESIYFPEKGSMPFKLENTNVGFNPLHEGNETTYYWIASNKFCSPVHVGTHIDAPFHFYENGWTVDEIPIERFFVPVSVIDIRKQVEKNSFYELSTEDVNYWIKENGMFPNNSAILVNAGWSKRYPDKYAYMGHPTDRTKFKFPGLSLDAVQSIFKLGESRGIVIAAFGVDFLSVHPVTSTSWKVHREICSKNSYIIENMRNLESLPATGARMMVMPMKIKGGSGGPARVIARLPYE